MPSCSLDIARTYLARGWTPVPVFHQDKKPTIPKGWPTLRYVDESAAWLEGSAAAESDLATLFSGQRNIGVVLGVASGGLVDIDLDCPEAVRLAPRLLPPTGAIFGRPSSLRAHWLYVAPGCETKKWAGMPYANGDGKTRIPTLIELRSTGGQTVFPGSTHVSGEPIAWAEEGEPAVVDADELREAGLRVAIAALMVRSAGFTDDEAVLFVHDEAAVRSLGGDLGKVLRPWLGVVPTPAAKKKAKRPDEGSDDFQEAVDRYNADHVRDYGQDGANECPMCGYHRGFGRLRGTGRWSCFAAPHVSSGGPGIKSATGDSYHGDALDIDAHAAGLSRDKLLVRDGYLRPPRQKAPRRDTSPPSDDAPPWVPGEGEVPYEEPVVHEAKECTPPTHKPAPPPPVWEEPFDRDSDPVLARALLAQLRADNQSCVADEGQVYCYDKVLGIWRAVPAEEMVRRVGRFDGRSFRDGGVLKLKMSRIEGVVRYARAHVTDGGFFRTAAPGVAFKNGMVTVGPHGAALEPLSADHRCRDALPFDYDPNAKCERWERFCAEILHGNSDPFNTYLMLQEFVGACLLGLATRYEKCLVLYGASGENGKSVFLEVVDGLFPPHMRCAIAPHSFGRNFLLAGLAGKRLNVVNEMPSLDVTGSDIFKAVVTGNPVTAEHKNKDPFTFTPIAGELFACNSLPGTSDTSGGYFRRWLIVELRRTFGLDEQEKGLGRSLVTSELQGIARWAVEGAARLRIQDNYTQSAATSESIADWRESSDRVLRWMTERADKHEDARDNTQHRTKARELYQDFAIWLQGGGFERINEGNFGSRLKNLKVPHGKAGTVWYGLKLKMPGGAPEPPRQGWLDKN